MHSGKRINIPTVLSYKYRNELSISELRTIIKTVLNSRRSKLIKAHVFSITLPHMGVIKSHGLKKRKGYSKLKTRDRKRKIRQQREQELTKENLLF